MSYEVPTRPLRRSRWPVLIPPLIALAVVVTAFMAGGQRPSEPALEGPVPSAEAAPVSTALTECNDLREFPCRDVVRVAQLALDWNDAPVASAGAWRSLICGNDSDCPRGILDGARPAGSVVFTFVDGSVAWVNVRWVDVSSRRFEDGTERLEAYVVRAFGAET